MPVKTRRWNDPQEPADGFRLLVTRYRPRGLPKKDETWDAWDKDLAPSVELHAAYFGKGGRTPISWSVYRARYLKEMLAQKPRIKALADRVAAGEMITLLCSSHCVREDRCHRSLLKQLIEARLS